MMQAQRGSLCTLKQNSKALYRGVRQLLARATYIRAKICNIFSQKKSTFILVIRSTGHLPRRSNANTLRRRANVGETLFLFLDILVANNHCLFVNRQPLGAHLVCRDLLQKFGADK